MNLSVIIPCLNEADHIAVQLEALANQAWSGSWEVIVSDNGSTDSSVAIAKQYARWLPNLRVVAASKRPGAAHARNMGAQVATGELLVFCDADDEVAPGWLAAIFEALAHHDFVASRYEPTKLNAPWVLQSRCCPQQEGLQAYKHPPFLPHAAASGMGIRRSLHEAIGGFDETMRLLEDTDYCWRLQLAGVKLHFVREAVVHYRFRHTLGSIYSQARGYGENNVLLYKKYRGQGMERLPFRAKANLIAWLRLIRALPQIQHPETGSRWVWQFGWRLGRLQGSIKHRVVAL